MALASANRKDLDAIIDRLLVVFYVRRALGAGDRRRHALAQFFSNPPEGTLRTIPRRTQRVHRRRAAVNLVIDKIRSWLSRNARPCCCADCTISRPDGIDHHGGEHQRRDRRDLRGGRAKVARAGIALGKTRTH
jgi:hypothetical protein